MNFVTVSVAELAANVVTLEVASLDTLRAGYHVTVAGCGSPFDGNHILTGANTITVGSVTTYTVTYAKTHANVAETDVDGRITPKCTWIGAGDVELFLGITPSGGDADFLEACVEAGNDWAYRRRQSAGYDDWADTIPAPDVALGTVIYTAGLYRERGSIDGYQSFQDLATIAPIGTNAQVLRLLGLNKPVVA